MPPAPETRFASWWCAWRANAQVPLPIENGQLSHCESVEIPTSLLRLQPSKKLTLAEVEGSGRDRELGQSVQP